MNPANDFWALRRRIGQAVWLLAFFAAYTPPDWTGDASVYIAGGNIISDGELADRLRGFRRLAGVRDPATATARLRIEIEDLPAVGQAAPVRSYHGR